MKKIPTLFERTYEDHCIVGIKDKVHPGMEWVISGDGVATLKVDGSCCAIIKGELYKRYDAKKGKNPPVGAIPCCDPDPITDHWPHWVKVNVNKPADKWFVEAFMKSHNDGDGTYEAVGPHFQGNPYNLSMDVLLRHGTLTDAVKDVPRDFDGLREYLRTHKIEGIVFWKDGEPQCKIKRSDFGFLWPIPGMHGYIIKE